LIAFGDHRHIAHAVGEQFVFAAGIVEYIDCNEVDIFFRKKLFRSEAAASPRLGEQDELVVGGAHMCIRVGGGVSEPTTCRVGASSAHGMQLAGMSVAGAMISSEARHEILPQFPEGRTQS
jgi:hypothetical protein